MQMPVRSGTECVFVYVSNNWYGKYLLYRNHGQTVRETLVCIDRDRQIVIKSFVLTYISASCSSLLLELLYFLHNRTVTPHLEYFIRTWRC